METDSHADAGRDLAFFGRVTASATHEIKNDLAVINETGQLALEIMALADQGREPDLNKLANLAERIVARVDRSNRVVKRLNTFAHSAEADLGRMDVAEAAELMVRCYARLAGMKRVELEFVPPDPGVGPTLQAKPFDLEQLLWSALAVTVEVAETGSVIRVAVAQDGGRVRIDLTGQLTEPPGSPLPELLERLSAEARSEAGSLTLELES